MATAERVQIAWVPLSVTTIPNLYVCSLCACTIEGSMRNRHEEWHLSAGSDESES